MAVAMKVKRDGGVVLTGVYVIPAVIDLRPVASIVQFQLHGYIDEATRREAGEMAAALGDAMSKAAELRELVSEANKNQPEQKNSKAFAAHQREIGRLVADVGQADIEQGLAQQAASNPDLSPCWTCEPMQLGISAARRALESGTIEGIKRVIYEELKKPGGLLAGGTDLL